MERTAPGLFAKPATGSWRTMGQTRRAGRSYSANAQGNGAVARAQTAPRSGRATASVPGRRRRWPSAASKDKAFDLAPSWPDRLSLSAWHAVLVLATGLTCGALASRIDPMVSPPYAALLGAAAFLSRAPRSLAGCPDYVGSADEDDNSTVTAAGMATDDMAARRSHRVCSRDRFCLRRRGGRAPASNSATLAAILSTVVLYPMMVAMWWHLHGPGEAAMTFLRMPIGANPIWRGTPPCRRSRA
jgi:hypothetical protein